MKQTRVIQEGRWLVIEFAEPHCVLSWAVVNGGMTQSRHIAWYKVENGEMDCTADPHNFLKVKLEQKGIANALGLLTSADLTSFVDIKKNIGRESARCVATVGMRNALRVGDLPVSSHDSGTINLIVQLSAPLSQKAFVEAVSIAAEARTAAVLEFRYPSIQTDLAATGTGTDCLGIAAPLSGNQRKYAGKHVDVGYLIGSAVYEAVYKGVKLWKEHHP